MTPRQPTHMYTARIPARRRSPYELACLWASYYYSKSAPTESYFSGAKGSKRSQIGPFSDERPSGPLPTALSKPTPHQNMSSTSTSHQRRVSGRATKGVGKPHFEPNTGGGLATVGQRLVPTVHCSRLLRRPPRQDRRVQVRHHHVRPTTILTVRNPPPMLPPSLQLLLDRTLRQMTTHPEHPSAMLSSHTACCLQGATARTRERRRQLRHRQGGR